MRGEAPRTATLLGVEEWAERRHDRGVIPLVHSCSVRGRRSDGELEFERLRVELADDVEPGVRKHSEHRDVLGQDYCDEALHAMGTGDLRKLLEQARADPPALKLVSDREGHLGLGWVSQPVVRGDGHDARAVGVRRGCR